MGSGEKLTKEDFIVRSNLIHNNKYDYSKVEYVRSKDNVIIVCPEHGEFKQTPKSHFRGSNCPECSKISVGMQGRLSIEDFTTRSNIVHNNKYDYSKVIYKTSKDKVIIICPKHGEFEQLPVYHLKHGCRQCASTNPSNTKSFIQTSSMIHNDKYDYSKSIYKNNISKVIIVCPEHGEFKQIPKTHLKGQGCYKCAKTTTGLKLKKTLDEFITEANSIHKNKYDYSKVAYNGIKNKIIIICPFHGEFEQLPNSHLRGDGCASCSFMTTTEQFIKKSILCHGDKYDYSKSTYENTNCKITIICSKHGEFKQSPRDHVGGAGCPRCRASKGESLIRNYLENNHISYISQYYLACRSRLDFYLPKFNLGIEFNGHQHYIPVSFGSKTRNPMESLLNMIKLDNRKLNYCKNNNINLLIIPFWDIKNIDNIMEQYLNNNVLATSAPPPKIENIMLSIGKV